jgi:hypothetical protein
MEKLSTDTLLAMPDHEIESLYRKISGNIRGLHKKSKKYNDPYISETVRELEYESCYVWRELETRRGRKIAHEQYLKSIS